MEPAVRTNDLVFETAASIVAVAFAIGATLCVRAAVRSLRLEKQLAAHHSSVVVRVRGEVEPDSVRYKCVGEGYVFTVVHDGVHTRVDVEGALSGWPARGVTVTGTMRGDWLVATKVDVDRFD